LDREYVHDLFVNVLSKPFVTKMPDYTDMKKTKILIISDTHTSLSFINLIKKEKPDIAIHAGDFTQFNHLSFDFPDEEKNKYFKY
jgi:predicted MPP superfamily phosphohydrolase